MLNILKRIFIFFTPLWMFLFELVWCNPYICTPIHTAVIKYRAEKYLEEKYGEPVEIVDYEIADITAYTYEIEPMWLEFSDGTIVYCDYGGKLYDDKQSAEINRAIYDEILIPTIECIGDCRFERRSGDEIITFSECEKILPGNRMCCRSVDEEMKSVSLYSEYYDGDIKEFLSKENTSVNLERVCIICDEDDDWQADFDILQEMIFEYFRDNDGISICALTEQGFNSGSRHYYQNGGLAEMKLWNRDKSSALYIQSYIEVMEGINVTSCEYDGFMLENGDIKFEQIEMTAEELQVKIDEAYESAADEYKSKHKRQIVNVSSPIYRVALSDRVKERMHSGVFDVYIKNDLQECAFSNELYMYDGSKNFGFDYVYAMDGEPSKVEIYEDAYCWFGLYDLED